MKKILTLTLFALLVGVNVNSRTLYVEIENGWESPNVYVWGDGNGNNKSFESITTVPEAGTTWYKFEIGDYTNAIVRGAADWDHGQTVDIYNLDDGSAENVYISVLSSKTGDNKYNVAKRTYVYPIFRNNVDKNWDSDVTNGTTVDNFTFTREFTKSAIETSSVSDLRFRFRAGYTNWWPQMYANSEGETLERGGSATVSYENQDYTVYSFSVAIPSYDYDAITLTAQYKKVDGAWKWIMSADVKAKITISSYGVSTFACEDALDFTGVSGITPYKGAVKDNVATFTVIDAPVPANTGIMVRGTASTTYLVPVVASGTAVDGNELFGVTVATPISGTDSGYKNLVLKAPNDELGFYLPTESFTVGAHTAYLHTAEANVEETTNAKVSLNFGDETGINTISRSNNDNVYYDLQGRRVANPTKGLFIVNGKKVIK